MRLGHHLSGAEYLRPTAGTLQIITIPRRTMIPSHLSEPVQVRTECTQWGVKGDVNFNKTPLTPLLSGI